MGGDIARQWRKRWITLIILFILFEKNFYHFLLTNKKVFKNGRRKSRQ